MTLSAGFVAALAVAFAIGDWIAVARSDRRGILIFKPLTLVALIGMALAIRPQFELQRELFLGALVWDLAGDVFLMLSERWFLAGLAAFLAGHLSYIAGFLAVGLRPQLTAINLTAGILVALVAAGLLAHVTGHRGLRRPWLSVAVFGYASVVTTMAIVAVGSRSPVAAVGGLLFLGSDGVLAWNRFVRPLAWAPLYVIVTYHAAQACLVIYLAAPSR